MKDGTYCYVLDNLRLDEDGLATLRFKYETLRGYTCPKHKIYDIFTYPKDVLKQVSGITNTGRSIFCPGSHRQIGVD